jgi:hypothetical protein
MTKHLLCGVLLVAACGGGSGDDDAVIPPDATATSPDAATCPTDAAFTFYFNRGGGTYTTGPDDPAANVSVIVPADAPAAAAWAGDDDGWATLLACARAALAPFDARIVETEPTAGDYSEIVFTETQLFQQGVFSVAPSTCTALEPHVGFVFGSEFADDPTAGCQYAMFDIGILTGLDISLEPCDFMTFTSGCTSGLEFTDTSAMCGAFDPVLCRCPPMDATQNSFQTMQAAYGACP